MRAAFAARYPGASARRAERPARPGRGTTYELAFTVDGKGREATFAEDGGFVGEEQARGPTGSARTPAPTRALRP